MNNINSAPLAVTVETAAQLLAVSPRTIYRLAEAGKIRIARITRDTPRVMMADLEAFLGTCSRPNPVADNAAEPEMP